MELEGNQSPSPGAPPRCKRLGSKGDVRREATARGAMDKGGVSGPLRGRRSQKMTQSNSSSS